jgi:glutamine synthetase
VDTLPEYISKKNIEVLTKHHVFTEAEIHSRYEIRLEAYCKTIHIEALTMVDIVKGGIIPACINYQDDLAKLLNNKKVCGGYDTSLEEDLLGRISKLSASLLKKLTTLENAILESKEDREILAQASFYRDKVCTAMSELREIVDELETLVAKKYWPLPSYAELLYSVI